MIDGDFKLTESKAINFYIIKRFGKNDLLGKDLKDQALVECLLGVLQDIRTPYFPLFWDKDYKEKLAGVVERITPKFDQLAKFYGNKDFALGYLTLVDFHISEFSHYVERLEPELYNKYEFLKRVRTAFENLPEIKKYY